MGAVPEQWSTESVHPTQEAPSQAGVAGFRAAHSGWSAQARQARLVASQMGAGLGQWAAESVH